MKQYKNPICIRHAHLSCPLPLTLESYWACEADCHHCPGRKLNEVWGKEQRVANPVHVEQKLYNALKNNNPQSALARALATKKTLWLGRKADPYQPLETKKHITKALIQILNKLQWSFIVCSRYTEHMLSDTKLFLQGKSTLLIEITPGGESDRELFERNRTTPIKNRLKAAAQWNKKDIHVGIRGEPFIPGYHTTKQFRDILKQIKSYGLHSYNTYNLHLNEYNARRLSGIGLDIEKIWRYNQDRLWQPIQRKLCSIADEENIILGCPDFVNVPVGWRCKANTCCGVNITKSFTFNTHMWRRLLLKGKSPKAVLKNTWENIGTEKDYEQGKAIIYGTSKDMYSMKDAGL
jgi:DNA repair photolyase